MVAPGEEANPLGAGKSRLVVLVGLGYAALGVALEALSVPFGQEIILVVSGGLIVMLLQRVGISRAVAVAAFAIFCFRAVPSAGAGVQLLGDRSPRLRSGVPRRARAGGARC